MSRRFYITIEETRQKTVAVNAENLYEALDMVEELYHSGDLYTTSDDVENVDFLCEEEDL